MSFSSDIKRELNKTNNLSNKELVKYELLGYLISSNTTIKNKKNLRFSTESDYNINRFSRLLSNINIEHDIAVNNKSFYITIKSKELEKIDFIEIEKVEESIYISQLTKEQLLEKAENRYALVIATAKRARQLSLGADPLIDKKEASMVTLAADEIAEGVITIIEEDDELF